jgi:hypothetical protein
MSLSNFEKMIQLATDSFDVKNDPNQLDVNENVIKRLLEIHPGAVTEKDDGNGPIIWILLIPTTNKIMEQFIDNQISELKLFEQTPVGIAYESIYLCSAMTLIEHRQKGITKKLCIEAIENIRKSNPITSLFVWPFSVEGERLAEKIAHETGLPLFKKTTS